MKTLWIGWLCWLGGAICAVAAEDLLLARPEAIEAWKDMRFGMFICWGPVSLTGREIGWSSGDPTPVEEYDALYQRWNPNQFDAQEWVKVAKQTSCRYIVFLLKHHDGCCLWDTKQTDNNIMRGPVKRDVAKEIALHVRNKESAYFPAIQRATGTTRTSRSRARVER